MSLHGVASFRGIDTPSLAAQGEQRRLSLFNIRRGNPPDLLAPLGARSKGGQSSPLVLLSLGLDLRRREFLAVAAGGRGPGCADFPLPVIGIEVGRAPL